MREYFPGNKIVMTGTFRNKATGTLENPNTVTLYVYDKLNTTRYTIDEADLTNSSTGVWTYTYTVPLSQQRGVWYYGFYGEDADTTPYAYSERPFFIKPSFADPYDGD